MLLFFKERLFLIIFFTILKENHFDCQNQFYIPYLHLHPGHGRAMFCLHWVSFTLTKLVNIAETVVARLSARVKCKHTPLPSELFCSYVLHVI